MVIKLGTSSRNYQSSDSTWLERSFGGGPRLASDLSYLPIPSMAKAMLQGHRDLRRNTKELLSIFLSTTFTQVCSLEQKRRACRRFQWLYYAGDGDVSELIHDEEAALADEIHDCWFNNYHSSGP